MASAASNRSSGWKQANRLFQEGCTLSLSPCLRKERLQKAAALYHQALRDADGKKGDMAVLNKNLGSTHWKFAELVQEDSAKDLLKFHTDQGCSHYIRALYIGRDCQTDAWLEGVHALFSEKVQVAIAAFKKFEQTLRWSCMRKLSTALSQASGVCEAAALCKEELANLAFLEGVMLLEDESLDRKDAARKCVSQMNEAYQLLVEAEQRGNIEQIDRVKMRLDEVYLYLASCESIQAAHQGDSLLASLLTNQEHLDMDLVWIVIDLYKQAAVLARERDMEAEGSACSRLGHVYKKVLKMDKTAHHYFFKAVQLALTFPPGKVNKMAWAQEAIAAVGEHQEKVKVEEAAKEAQERQPYLDMLKDELAALKVAATGSAESLLAHVYEKHPPKKADHRMAPLGRDAGLTKKALLRAISHYHPDHNLELVHGKKWSVLCGEIVKVLNQKYDYYK